MTSNGSKPDTKADLNASSAISTGASASLPPEAVPIDLTTLTVGMTCPLLPCHWIVEKSKVGKVN